MADYESIKLRLENAEREAAKAEIELTNARREYYAASQSGEPQAWKDAKKQIDEGWPNR